MKGLTDMDPLVWVVLAAALGFSLWRLSRTFRAARTVRGKDIEEKLAQLRKKRDEQ